MLHQRHELDMGVAQLDEVGHQPCRQIAVAVEAAVRVPHPAAQVHFVNAHRRRQPVARCPLLHPAGVFPPVGRVRRHAAGRGRTPLEGAGVGIGLDPQRAAAAQTQLEAVQRTGRQFGKEQLPDTGGAEGGHRVHPAVPAVEVADHRYPLRIGRPDPEADAGHAVAALRYRAEAAPGLAQAPGIEQVEVILRGLWHKGVDVVLPDAVDIQPPRPRQWLRAAPFEEVGTAAALQRRPFAIRQGHRNRFRMRPQHPQAPPRPIRMQAQNGKGIMFSRFEQRGAGRVGHRYIFREFFCYRADCSRNGEITMQSIVETRGPHPFGMAPEGGCNHERR
jgi:hypothetical protein